jgi:hypothetical protein
MKLHLFTCIKVNDGKLTINPELLDSIYNLYTQLVGTNSCDWYLFIDNVPNGMSYNTIGDYLEVSKSSKLEFLKLIEDNFIKLRLYLNPDVPNKYYKVFKEFISLASNDSNNYLMEVNSGFHLVNIDLLANFICEYNNSDHLIGYGAESIKIYDNSESGISLSLNKYDSTYREVPIENLIDGTQKLFLFIFDIYIVHQLLESELINGEFIDWADSRLKLTSIIANYLWVRSDYRSLNISVVLNDFIAKSKLGVSSPEVCKLRLPQNSVYLSKISKFGKLRVTKNIYDYNQYGHLISTKVNNK